MAVAVCAKLQLLQPPSLQPLQLPSLQSLQLPSLQLCGRQALVCSHASNKSARAPLLLCRPRARLLRPAPLRSLSPPQTTTALPLGCSSSRRRMRPRLHCVLCCRGLQRRSSLLHRLPQCRFVSGSDAFKNQPHYTYSSTAQRHPRSERSCACHYVHGQTSCETQCHKGLGFVHMRACMCACVHVCRPCCVRAVCVLCVCCVRVVCARVRVLGLGPGAH